MKKVRIKFRGELLTYAEISALIGIPAALVQSRHNKGRRIDMPIHTARGHALGAQPRTTWFEGAHRTYREISEMTGVPIGTVKSRLYYGRPLGAVVNYHLAEKQSPLAGLERASVDGSLPYELDDFLPAIIEKHGPLTMEQVGHLLGCSRQRVHQIERQAMRKLRKRGVSRRQLEIIREKRETLRELQEEREARRTYRKKRGHHVIQAGRAA